MGSVLFYTHFWLSRVLTAGSLRPDSPYRWYCAISSLMRKPLFFFSFFWFPLSLWLPCEGIRESIWLEMGAYEGVCLGISLFVWFEYQVLKLWLVPTPWYFYNIVEGWHVALLSFEKLGNFICCESWFQVIIIYKLLALTAVLYSEYIRIMWA